MNPDDGFDEETLLRALRAPGSARELKDEEQYVGAFRATLRPFKPSKPSGRRGGAAARRLGAGTALAVAVGLSGGGVAAAYTRSLPAPLQDFAHRVLGPVGAPPADDEAARSGRPARRSSAVPTPSTPATPTLPAAPAPTTPTTPSPPPAPSKPSKPSPGSDGRPTESATPTPQPSETVAPSPTVAAPQTPTAQPTDDPTSTPTPTDTPSASATPPPVDGISLDGAAHRVDVGATTSFAGVVTSADGSPVAGVEVALQRRGPDGWTRLAKAATDESGGVAFTSPPVTETMVVRLHTAGVHSPPWRVRMHPLLTVTYESSTAVVAASAEGGQPGDQVQLLKRQRGQWVAVAEAVLDEEASARFEVKPPKHQTTYAVLLPPTDSHTASRQTVPVAASVSP